MTTPLSTAVFQCVLDEIVLNGGKVSLRHGELLNSTDNVDMFHSASHLVAQKKVTKVIAQPSGRHFYRVSESHRERYLCFLNYCSCPYFLKVANQSPESLCKHVAAVRIAVSFSEVVQVLIKDVEFANAIASESSFENSSYQPEQDRSFV